MELKYVLLALMLALGTVSAGDFKPQVLAAAMDSVKCRVDFTVGVLDSLNTAVASSTLTDDASKLQADETQLQSYADSNDASGFRSYIVGTFDPDMLKSRQDALAWRTENGRKVLGNGTALNLVSQYQSLRSTFDSCELGALKGYANAKVDAYNAILDVAQNRTDSLGAKGIDTAGMSSVISSAKSEIVDPLQSGIQSATTGAQLAEVLHSYCLYDGCRNGTNFHFAAKFEIAKLTAIESHVQSLNGSSNHTSELNTVTSDLSSANSALSSVGTAPYGPGQSDSVWNPIKDAAKVLTQVIHEMRS